MFDLYLTSTFRHEWNRNFNPLIGKFLEEKGYKCYLPHRDTNQKALPPEIYKQDMQGIQESKIILAIAENESPNWGAEIGFAYGIKKPIIALASDNHSIPLILNEMVTEKFKVSDLDNIETYIDKLTAILNKYI